MKNKNTHLEGWWESLSEKAALTKWHQVVTLNSGRFPALSPSLWVLPAGGSPSGLAQQRQEAPTHELRAAPHLEGTDLEASYSRGAPYNAHSGNAARGGLGRRAQGACG